MTSETVVYIRTSTEEQSPENQLQDISVLLAGRPHVVFSERQSAFLDFKDRPRFVELLSLIRRRKVRHLFVWDWDRIYRNRKKLVEFMSLCKACGCQVHSFRQSFMEDLSSVPEPWNEVIYDLLLNVMGWMAEDESKKKSERVKAAFTKKNGLTVSKEKGLRVGRRPLPVRTRERILEAHRSGLSLRKIQESVFTTDKHGNMRRVGLGTIAGVVKGCSENDS